MREPLPALPSVSVLVVGAGVIGLSLALELHLRGIDAAVVDPGEPLAQATSAAAGMLAVLDPYNPPELLPLAALSRDLYPGFLATIGRLSGTPVPFQTDRTLQTFPNGVVCELQEHSVDPRQLGPALLHALRRAGVPVLSFTELTPDLPSGPEAVVFTTGAWGHKSLPLRPRKGQMLRVRLPPDLRLDVVHRSEHVYVVPRTSGPQAGSALVGATVEDVGFDLSTSTEALAGLRHRGAAFVPQLAEEHRTPTLEAWAGLRPATPDGLPILGEWSSATGISTGSGCRSFLATGHYRNGILLAPATATVMADLLQGRPSPVDLQPFAASRFRSLSGHV